MYAGGSQRFNEQTGRYDPPDMHAMSDQSMAETARLQRQNVGPSQGGQALADRTRRLAAAQALQRGLSQLNQPRSVMAPTMQNRFARQGTDTTNAGRWIGGNR